MTDATFLPGQVIDLDISGYSSEGEGVGRRDNVVFFVPGAVAGEKVRARVRERRKNFYRAACQDVILGSAERRPPPCPSFGRCGGCGIQHLSYEEQLRFKRTRISDAVERIGRLDPLLVRPVTGLADPWRYRNKVTFHVTEERGRTVPGLLRADSHHVIPVEDCLLADPAAVPLAARALTAVASRHGSALGLVERIMVRTGWATGERMTVLYTTPGAPPLSADVGAAIVSGNASVTNVTQIGLPRPGSKTAPPRLLCGRGYITEKLRGIAFRISAESFFQVNTRQAEALYAAAVAAAAPGREDRILDAYCGLGGFALCCAPRAAEVLGIERDRRMVRLAGETAARNGIANARFIRGDLEKGPARDWPPLDRYSTLIIDPPRRGLDRRFIASCARLPLRTIIYASCDPGTLARDCRRLADVGFSVREIIPFDMFPQTVHVECLACLERGSPGEARPLDAHNAAPR